MRKMRMINQETHEASKIDEPVENDEIAEDAKNLGGGGENCGQ